MATKPFRMVLPENLCGLSHLFTQAGHQLYVVGGAVRDALLNKKPKDYDLATDATPDRVIEIVKGVQAWKTLEVGKSFGVIKVVWALPEHLYGMPSEYEIATFRTDIGEGRRPDSVVFTTIDEDVKRRDLTINALFYDVYNQQVVDLVGGLDDIEGGIIRTVGEPEDRFREDRLRVLRAIRFVHKMGYRWDEKTYGSVLMDNTLSGVSPERVRDEFVKALSSATSLPKLLTELDVLEMWNKILPGLRVVTSVDTLVSSRGITSQKIPVILALLLDENDPKFVIRRLNELRYTSIEVAQVSFLHQLRHLNVDNAYRLKRAFYNANLTPDDLVDYADQRGYPSSQLLATFLSYEPTTSGNDLLAEGYTGASLGHELERRETVRFREQLEQRSLSHQDVHREDVLSPGSQGTGHRPT